MARKSRVKGKRGELEAAKALAESFPKACGGAERSYHQARDGDEAADLENTGRLWVEVKRGERQNVQSAYWKTASAAVKDDLARIPIVMSRRNREQWLVTLSFRDFVALVREHLLTEEGEIRSE